ncbi:hypothetical protein F4780DRAFT_150524 [Xylariomycetidae sp. FL0641]|nr:hypothetical protein F4780DRAFT_150524 [Xylariomycetidae sp. FL0641]
MAGCGFWSRRFSSHASAEQMIDACGSPSFPAQHAIRSSTHLPCVSKRRPTECVKSGYATARYEAVAHKARILGEQTPLQEQQRGSHSGNDRSRERETGPVDTGPVEEDPPADTQPPFHAAQRESTMETGSSPRGERIGLGTPIGTGEDGTGNPPKRDVTVPAATGADSQSKPGSKHHRDSSVPSPRKKQDTRVTPPRPTLTWSTSMRPAPTRPTPSLMTTTQQTPKNTTSMRDRTLPVLERTLEPRTALERSSPEHTRSLPQPTPKSSTRGRNPLLKSGGTSDQDIELPTSGVEPSLVPSSDAAGGSSTTPQVAKKPGHHAGTESGSNSEDYDEEDEEDEEEDPMLRDLPIKGLEKMKQRGRR